MGFNNSQIFADVQVAVSISNLNATAEGARQVAAGVARNVIQAVLQVSNMLFP